MLKYKLILTNEQLYTHTDTLMIAQLLITYIHTQRYVHINWF